MQCPDCGKLRHPGTECDPVYEDEPDALELLAIDAVNAVRRYREERNKRKAEHGSPRPSH